MSHLMYDNTYSDRFAFGHLVSAFDCYYINLYAHANVPLDHLALNHTANFQVMCLLIGVSNPLYPLIFTVFPIQL
jgi:hypothetical protein